MPTAIHQLLSKTKNYCPTNTLKKIYVNYTRSWGKDKLINLR